MRASKTGENSKMIPMFPQERQESEEQTKSQHTLLVGANMMYLDGQQIEEQTERCLICNEVLGLPRSDGEVEELYILPCSHTFGNLCISRWLESDSQNQDCPVCRRRMVYRGCGHLIKPCIVKKAPAAASEADMPDKCLVCRAGGVLEETLGMMRARQLAEERALEGLTQLMGVFGGLSRGNATNIEERLTDIRRHWRKQTERLYAELEKHHDGW